MLDLILIVAVGGTLLCGLVGIAILGLVLFDTGRALHRIYKREVLPEPDPKAERTYGQKYFERVIGRKVN